MADQSAGRQRRVFYGALDQVFSSASNGLIMFAVAVTSSPEAFGAVALVMTALVATVGAQRGGLGIPMLLLADKSGTRSRLDGSFSLLASLFVGLALATLIMVFGSGIGLPAVFLALSAPFVLYQDVLRYVAIAGARPQVAALWDGLWMLGTALLLVLAWAGVVAVPIVISCWGGLALVSSVGMSWNLRILPRCRGWVNWIRTGWRDRARYGVDAGIEQTTMLIVLAMAAVLVNATASAALRGATVLLAPIAILASALQFIVISESTRESAEPRHVWRMLLRVTLGMSCLTLVGGVVFTLLPLNIGNYLLGESFEIAREVLPVVTFEYMAAALTFSLGVYLKTFNRSAAALRFKLFVMTVTLLASVCGALMVGNAFGIALGLAAGTLTAGLVGLAVFTPWRHRERVVAVDFGARPDESTDNRPSHST